MAHSQGQKSEAGSWRARLDETMGWRTSELSHSKRWLELEEAAAAAARGDELGPSNDDTS